MSSRTPSTIQKAELVNEMSMPPTLRSEQRADLELVHRVGGDLHHALSPSPLGCPIGLFRRAAYWPCSRLRRPNDIPDAGDEPEHEADDEPPRS